MAGRCAGGAHLHFPATNILSLLDISARLTAALYINSPSTRFLSCEPFPLCNNLSTLRRSSALFILSPSAPSSQQCPQSPKLGPLPFTAHPSIAYPLACRNASLVSQPSPSSTAKFPLRESPESPGIRLASSTADQR